MATRTFCDHCGNTCRSPNRFMFGPQPAQVQYEAEKSYAHAIAGAGGVAQLIKQAQAQQNTPQQAPKHPTKVVDLCDTCAPIWYERVDKLCRASDPEEKTNV